MTDGRVDGGLDDFGMSWTIGVAEGRVALMVDPHAIMLRFGAERRDQFARAWAEAERRAEAAGSPACKCGISGTGEVIPPACPVHGTPCGGCDGLEECKADCPGEPVDGEGSDAD